MNIHDVLGPRGLLAENNPDYEFRLPQIAMANLVQDAIVDGFAAAIEAGTGTGKSLAYLTPIVLSGERAVVSTANKTLQAQLLHKDLPLLQRTLAGKMTFRFAAAKGKSNYLCLLKVLKACRQGLVNPWLEETESGDIDDAPWLFTPQDVTQFCAGDDCLRKNCPQYPACFYYAAKLRQQAADIIVTNHALLCQQLLNEDAAILPPDIRVCVVDEAHQLESYIISAQSIEVSQWAFRGPAAPLHREGMAFLDALGERMRADDDDVLIPSTYQYPEGIALAEALEDLSQNIGLGPASLQDDALAGARVDAARQQVRNLADHVRELSVPTATGYVRHVLRRNGQYVGAMTRIEAAGTLARLWVRYQTTIYTSATLSSGPDDFSYFQRSVGLLSARTMQVESPFDYAEQCLLYIPMDAGMPEPDYRNRDLFDEAARQQTLALVRAARGGALCLFTSNYATRRAAEYLRRELGASCAVRAQGEAGRNELIAWLRDTPHAVLCATSSFWEGVDIQGEALRLVVIDKLPFAAASPVEKARQEAAGRRAFVELSVPEATLRLKQGFGRLIRSGNDLGVVAILDPRLWVKGYGRRIAAALPDATVVTEIAAVEAFYANYPTYGPQPAPEPVAPAVTVSISVNARRSRDNAPPAEPHRVLTGGIYLS